MKYYAKDINARTRGGGAEVSARLLYLRFLISQAIARTYEKNKTFIQYLNGGLRGTVAR